jgi:magnesium transporter
MFDPMDQDYADDILESLLIQDKIDELAKMLVEMPTAQVCEFLNAKEPEEIKKLLQLLPSKEQGKIVTEFDYDLQYKLFKIFDRNDFALIFQDMFSDTRADFYQELSNEEQTEFLPFLDKPTREDVIALSAYPPETAGGIMNTDFATLYVDMTAKEALAKLRKDAPSKKMIYYLYVVNESMKMQGIVTLKDLIMVDPDAKIKELLNEFYIYATVDEDQESVASKVEKHDLVALPVLNAHQQLMGIIPHDDILDVIRAEHTEDMEKFMGIVPSEEENNYLDTTAITHFRKRVLWIVGLAAIGLISGMIIHYYQEVLEKLIVLALYMPMMAATGGNSGSQAATVVIRALALGEVSDREWMSIVFKEAKISFLLSLCVGGLTFLKIAFLSSQSSVPTDLNLTFVAFVISSAIAVQVISSAIIGAGLPLIVKRVGGDPAVAASPAITTVVDITGLLIYFSFVTYSITV